MIFCNWIKQFFTIQLHVWCGTQVYCVRVSPVRGRAEHTHTERANRAGKKHTQSVEKKRVRNEENETEFCQLFIHDCKTAHNGPNSTK